VREPLRVLLLEDDAADAELIEQELRRGGLEVTMERVDTRDGFSDALRDLDPDVVLSDHSLGQFNATAALRLLQGTRPGTPLIVVSGAIDEQVVVSCLKAGAENYVHKRNLERLVPAIEAALLARRQLVTLTPRQRQVLRLVAEGHTTREIARKLRLSVKTVETHRGDVMKRLGIHDVVGLVRFSVRMGLVSPEP
jgi:DNA-binding NarL/FixJ family response regulator